MSSSSFPSQAHLARVSTLSGPDTRSGIRPVIRDRLAEEPATSGRGFPLPFGHRRWLVGPSQSRSGSSAFLTVDLPAPRCRARDPVGVTTFHTRELRPGRVPPISRGRRCSPGRVPSSTGVCRLGTASPCPLPTAVHRQGPLYETSTEVHAIHPSGLPLTRGPRMAREPFGVSLSFAPCRYQQHTSERGRASSTSPKLIQPKPDSALLSASSLASCDLVSQRQLRTFVTARPAATTGCWAQTEAARCCRRRCVRVLRAPGPLISTLFPRISTPCPRISARRSSGNDRHTGRSACVDRCRLDLPDRRIQQLRDVQQRPVRFQLHLIRRA